MSLTVLVQLSPELRKRLSEFSKVEEKVIFCLKSIRAHLAQRVLYGAGFRNVKFMDRSLVACPHDAYLYEAYPDR
jgi:hypothetical protein